MMASPILLVDTVGSITMFIEAVDGTPATGLTFSDVTASIKKAGAAAFSLKTLTAPDFTDMGSGFYEVDFSTTETDTLGNLDLRILGGTIRTALRTAYIAASAPTNPNSTPGPQTTSIFGYVVSPSGAALAGASVSANILAVPTLLHPGTEGMIVSTGLVTTKTDADGFFSFNLITGTQMDVFIPAANYRRTLTVPATSVNLFDIV